jgi:hypothetical protein
MLHQNVKYSAVKVKKKKKKGDRVFKTKKLIVDLKSYLGGN